LPVFKVDTAAVETDLFLRGVLSPSTALIAMSAEPDGSLAVSLAALN
jgi:hypothetical protein